MPLAMLEQVPMEDRLDYLKHNKIVKDGLNKFLETGSSLKIIRDRKLYRVHYKTFEDYCRETLSFTRQHVNQIINAAVAVEELPKDLERKVSNLEAGTALAQVPAGERKKVVSEIADTGQPVTAKAIKAKAAEVVAAPAMKMTVYCETGAAIPHDLLPLWLRRKEVDGLLSALSKVKCAVEKGLKASDPLYGELSNATIATLTHARAELSLVMPYAVCSCNGHHREKCLVCHGRGLVSKLKYETLPKEFREMREKVKMARMNGGKK